MAKVQSPRYDLARSSTTDVDIEEDRTNAWRAHGTPCLVLLCFGVFHRVSVRFPQAENKVEHAKAEIGAMRENSSLC